jgi:hypothetical protein
MIKKEIAQYIGSGGVGKIEHVVSNGSLESGLVDQKDRPGMSSLHGPVYYFHEALSRWQVYHFHDTSMTAGMRREVGLDQGKQLQTDAGNLAAFLFRWRETYPEKYCLLKDTIRRVAPYFDDFELVETSGSIEDTVQTNSIALLHRAMRPRLLLRLDVSWKIYPACSSR